MSKHFCVQLALLPLAIVAMSISATATLGADASPEAARLDLFTQADGATFFALSLKPTAPVAPAASRDVVVLVDTSASQTGEYRDKALAALDALAGRPRPERPGQNLRRRSERHRDERVVCRARRRGSQSRREEAGGSGSVGIDGHGGRDSLGRRRLRRGDEAAGGGLHRRRHERGQPSRHGEVSTSLAKTLVDARAPVNSYAVGPRLDLQLLGALAGRTGGVMLAGGDDVAGAAAGTALAAAAKAGVYWPTAVTLPKDRLTEVFPKDAPPLRSDRDSVLIGTLKGEGPIDVKMTANTAEGTKELAWSVAPGKSSDNNKYLAALVDRARVDGGVSLPLVDSASLQFARNATEMGTANFAQLAREALASGSLDSATRLAEEVLRRNPGDREASAILAEVKTRRGQAGPAAQAAPAAEMNLVGDAPAEKPPAATGAFAQAFEGIAN